MCAWQFAASLGRQKDQSRDCHRIIAVPQRITDATVWTSVISADVAIILAFTAAAVLGGALTLRRRTS